MTHQQQWRATVVWPRPAGATRSRLAALTKALPGYGIVTDHGDGHLTAQMTVTAGTLRRATDTALTAASTAYQTALGAAAHPTQLRVLTVEDFDHEIAAPAAMDLVGPGEIGDMLGVTKQRAAQLAQRPDFPAPVATLKAGPVFTRTSVQEFERRWDRSNRGGRPRKTPDPAPTTP